MREENVPGSGLVMSKDREVGQGGVLEPHGAVVCLASNLTSPGFNLLTKAS